MPKSTFNLSTNVLENGELRKQSSKSNTRRKKKKKKRESWLRNKGEMSNPNKTLGSTGEFFRRRDQWRKHPMLSNQFRHATPGLGIALVAFGIYLVGEQVYNRVYAPSSSASHHTSSASHWEVHIKAGISWTFSIFFQFCRERLF